MVVAGGDAGPEALVVRLLLGLALSAVIGLVAYRRGSLTASGVLGAVLVGTAIFGFGGLVRGLLLIAFFVSSSALSHYKAAQKQEVEERFSKGSRRDLGQTLANGGAAVLLAAAIALVERESAAYPVLALAFYGALATVTADTWATELGVLAQRHPVLITSGRTVPAGTSGGVTREGTEATLAGALFIGLVGFVLTQGAAFVTGLGWLRGEWVIVPIAGAAGVIGATVDSLLGATVQAVYRCDACGVETERTVHRCGGATRLVRGRPWLNNDVVNFAASAAGALAAALLALVIF